MNAVRTGAARDAGFAAALHASEISQGFLPSLGTPFLERLYRRITLERPSFLLVAETDREPVGFVAGSEDVARLYRAFLWRDGVPAAVHALPRVLRSWRFVLETLRYPASEPGSADLPGAELLAVAVAPQARGRGVGHALVDAFVAELVARRVPAARVVVGADNATAIALYRRAGFASTTTVEVHKGTPSLVLTWR